jgi:hypothetical protein
VPTTPSPQHISKGAVESHGNMARISNSWQCSIDSNCTPQLNCSPPLPLSPSPPLPLSPSLPAQSLPLAQSICQSVKPRHASHITITTKFKAYHRLETCLVRVNFVRLAATNIMSMTHHMRLLKEHCYPSLRI